MGQEWPAGTGSIMPVDFGQFLPQAFIDLEKLTGLGAASLAHACQPVIELYFAESAKKLLSRVGASADVFGVINPRLSDAVSELTLNFCEATNQTTSLQLAEALGTLREDLRSGITEGVPMQELVKRVGTVFDQAEDYRAERIATSETSRAIHLAEHLAAKASGVVRGWKWLASGDACEECLAINGKEVGFQEPFATGMSKNPAYAEVFHPPLHPNCQCTEVELLSGEDAAPGVELEEVASQAAAFDDSPQASATVPPIVTSTLPTTTPSPPESIPLSVSPPPPIIGVGKRVPGKLLTKITKAVHSLPANVQNLLHNNGCEIHVVRRITDHSPHLAGQPVPGWLPGSTWENVDGFYDWPRKLVVVAQQYIPFGKSRYKNSSRREGAFRHETGHAVNHALGFFARDPSFQNAYNADRLLHHAQTTRVDPYYLQPNGSGESEIFAEVFAQLHGGGADLDSPNLVPDWPNVAKLIQIILGNLP